VMFECGNCSVEVDCVSTSRDLSNYRFQVRSFVIKAIYHGF
jgi:hypothetical protein